MAWAELNLVGNCLLKKKIFRFMSSTVICQQKEHVLFIQDFIAPVAHQEIQIDIFTFITFWMVP